MRRIAVINQKGGSGKTTLAVNLAAALGEQAHPTLLVDLDADHHATSWLGLRPAPGLRAVIAGEAPLLPLVRSTKHEALDVVVADGGLFDPRGLPSVEAGGARPFARALAALPPDRFEFVIVDCPPAFGALHEVALAAATEPLVPVEATAPAFPALDRLLREIDRVREKHNPELEPPRIVVCRTRRAGPERRVEARLRERFGDRVLGATVRESARIPEARERGLAVTRHFPGGGVAEDFRALARELWRVGSAAG
jgi:chromosome partitioning protein